MDKLILQGPSGEVELATKVVDDCAKLRPLLSRECMAIFSMLQNKPSYPALIAKELSINEQKAYYYCKQLRNAGLIEIERSEERNGAIAKYYSAPFDSFSLVPANGAMHGLRTLSKGSRDARNPASSLLQDFLRNGVFFAKIVVGSPDPHGPAKARCRDGHLAAGLAAFIGVNCAGFEFPLVFLDTMVGDLRHENSNLVILGGPVTNKIAEQANQFLPIRFSASAGNWIVSSELSGKQYGEEAIGIVEKVFNKRNKNNCC